MVFSKTQFFFNRMLKVLLKRTIQGTGNCIIWSDVSSRCVVTRRYTSNGCESTENYRFFKKKDVGFLRSYTESQPSISSKRIGFLDIGFKKFFANVESKLLTSAAGSANVDR